MKRFTRWAIPVLLAVSALPAETVREPVFVSFSAKDGNRIFVRDLKREEVTVLVDDQPVELRFFSYQDVRTAIAFVIENSPRTAFYRKSLPQFGRINTLDRIRYRLIDDFLEPLAQNAQLLIADFHQDLEIRQDFTDDLYALRSALDRLEPNLGILDRDRIPVGRMLARSVSLLQERPERRKALVFFTTTIDTDSVNDLEEYREMLRFADVDVFVVSFAVRQASGQGYSHAERVNRFYFSRLTEETSGQLYLSGEFVYLDELMDDLRARLTHTYTVGFYVEPKRHRDVHSLEVRLSRPKCEVRHRKTIYY